ncbi:hypothetical protein Z517_06028 [Fonsecaea pedrosoi CBS 271.37]|uniref:Uncharacterized protein n=1 Tax=Fonsecaea pedrosoi CBS 271.37 TaxID=1442368 RepID=A0A0D2DNU3_9EURO|nr:uncharacterized protein Z517_06028 [Fonsecaea pedrosoi CBS 271.37]KIW79416.1 hypothetical protein Z517_06028 [Fonsecaea pedrosoi CBS 271.37]
MNPAAGDQAPATQDNSGPTPLDYLADEATKRLKEFHEQARVQRATDRLEREQQVAESHRREVVEEVAESNPENEISGHSPRILEAAEILLSLRHEVLAPLPSTSNLQGGETNRETEIFDRGSLYQQPPALSTTPVDEIRDRTENIENQSTETHLVSEQQPRPSENENDGPSSNEHGEDANSRLGPADAQDESLLRSEGEGVPAENRDRLIQRRLQLLLEIVQANEEPGPIESDSTGERVTRDLNYIADPADYTLYRTASGQERRIIHHEPRNPPSSPPRAETYTNNSQAELDPDLHYWTSPDGLKHDMKKYKPDPNAAPPAKRKWDDVIAAAQKEQQEAAKPGVKPKPKPGPKGKKGKGRAGASSSSAPAKRAATTSTPRSRRAAKPPPVAGSPMRETRSAAKRKRDEVDEAKEVDSGEDGAAAPPPAKKKRFMIILRMPPNPAAGSE